MSDGVGLREVFVSLDLDCYIGVFESGGWTMAELIEQDDIPLLGRAMGMSHAETDTLVLYCALAKSLQPTTEPSSRTTSCSADDDQRARTDISSRTDVLHEENAALAARLLPRSPVVGWWLRLVDLLCPLTVDSTSDDLVLATNRLREADLALRSANAAAVAATREFWCDEALELNEEQHTPAPPKEPIAVEEKRSDGAAKRKLTLDVAERSVERRDWMDAALKGLLGGEVPRKMSGMHLATFEQR